jgi:DNA-directed RNA polymerase specialized sigma subunit
MANCTPTTGSVQPVRRRPRTGYLATPLSPEEQRRTARMYREHQGLLRLLGRKLCRKYPFVDAADVFSCIDQAFVKTCRAWDPARGTFSTLLTVFAEGDVLHFIRDGNWTVKAPGAVRRIGQLARKMLDRGHDTPAICAELGISAEQLKLAMVATSPTDHDIRGFDLHVCPRPTPWDVLEAEEAS